MLKYSVLKKLFVLTFLLWVSSIIGLAIYQHKFGVENLQPIIILAGLLSIVIFYLALSLIFTAIRISAGLSIASSTAIESQIQENPLFSPFLAADCEMIIKQKKTNQQGKK